MIFGVAMNIETSLTSIETAMAVLEAAIERAESCGQFKAEDSFVKTWQEEVAEICKLMVATERLMREPVEMLEDSKGAAYQLAESERAGRQKSDKAGDPA